MAIRGLVCVESPLFLSRLPLKSLFLTFGFVVHLPLRIFTIWSNPGQHLRVFLNLTNSSRGSRDRALTFPGWSKIGPKQRNHYIYKLIHVFCI